MFKKMGETSGEKGQKQLLVRCAFEDFGRLQSALEGRKLTIVSAQAEYIPQTQSLLDEAQAKDVRKLIDRLQQDDDVQDDDVQNDDVQNVFSNLA